MAMQHEDLWRALDTLAAENGMTPSGLARAAGLDATTFNRSKRRGVDGRPRWPSTESLSRVLAATGASLEAFTALVAGARALSHGRRDRDRPLRVTKLNGCGLADRFDAQGCPSGRDWEHREAPMPADPGDYALRVETADLKPALCEGDLVMVSPEASIRNGDRVVASVEGEVAPALFRNCEDDAIELAPLGRLRPARRVPASRLDWMHRITWIGR